MYYIGGWEWKIARSYRKNNTPNVNAEIEDSEFYEKLLFQDIFGGVCKKMRSIHAFPGFAASSSHWHQNMQSFNV